MENTSQSSTLEELEAVIEYQFVLRDHLTLALTHKSFANEMLAGHSTVGHDNERLEFLGDAVLDLTLSDILMRRFPNDSEGGLSKKRASLVNEETLFRIAGQLTLERLIRLGKGEVKTGGLAKPRILASSVEAMLGAVFLDGGYQAVSRVVEKLFLSLLDDVSRSDVDFRDDFKTRLQERVQEKHRSTPIYRVERETGPDHDKQFEVSVRLFENIIATGVGRSKKAAEQDAARQALEKMT